MLTAGHFNYDGDQPLGKLGELNTKIEAAIELGTDDALDAVSATIQLLDEVDGDPDLEASISGDDTPTSQPVRLSWGEFWGSQWADDEGRVGEYGFDQSDGPLNSVGEPRPGFAEHCWRGA